MYCFDGAKEFKGFDGAAAATVAPAVMECDGEMKGGAGAAAALPHAVAPVGAPSAYCCGGERSAYCCGGEEESEVGDREEEKDGDAAAALPHAVAPVGAPSAYCCGGERSVYCYGGAEEPKRRKRTATRLLCLRTRPQPWERQARRRRGFTSIGEVEANRAAARSSVGFVKTK